MGKNQRFEYQIAGAIARSNAPRAQIARHRVPLGTLGVLVSLGAKKNRGRSKRPLKKFLVVKRRKKSG